MNKRIIILIAVTFVAMVAGFILVTFTKPDPGDDLVTLPVFRLTADDGAAFTDKQLEGKTSLIFFGFTHCPDICPATLGILSEALTDMPADVREGLQPLLITVDPDRDTPKVMAEYIAPFHPSITGLTGEEDTIQQLIRAVSAYAKLQEPDEHGHYDVSHTGDVFVINAQKQFLGKFPYGTPPKDIVAYLTK